MVGIFAHYRINHHPITGQPFFDDPHRQRRTLHPLFFAGFAGTLLAFGDPHKVLCRFNVKLLCALVADHHRFLATFTGDTLLRATGNDLFDPRQLGWQLLAPGMLARFLERQFQLLALTLSFYFCTADSRL